MKYKYYNNNKLDLESRIRKEEERHYSLTIDLKMAEAACDDDKILDLQKQIDVIENVIKSLHDL